MFETNHFSPYVMAEVAEKVEEPEDDKQEETSENADGTQGDNQEETSDKVEGTDETETTGNEGAGKDTENDGKGQSGSMSDYVLPIIIVVVVIIAIVAGVIVVKKKKA